MSESTASHPHRRRAPLVAALVVAVTLLVGSVAIAVPWLVGTAGSTSDGSTASYDESGVPAWMDRMHDAMHGTAEDQPDRTGRQMGPRRAPAPTPTSSGTF